MTYCGALPARAIDPQEGLRCGKTTSAAIKNTELILATDIGLELGGELVSWPIRESKSMDAAEDGVFGCPLLDGLGVNC